MNFILAEPKMLWLLVIVVAPLVLFYWWAWRKRQELIRQFISSRLLEILKVGVSARRQQVRMGLVTASVVLIVLALTRPQWGFVWEEAKQRGLDIIIAVDTSNSMLADDMPPNRLARAKLAALDLMHRAKSDRLGLVAFAGSSFLVCPLTLDDAAFNQSVDSLNTQTISQGGTALADAIDTAIAAFKEEAGNHRVLVLFTDGEDHDGQASQAAERAAKQNIKVFTIGIGSPEGVELRIRDEQGHVEYIRDEDGKPVKSHLNETLLKDIAVAGGGFYLPLHGTKTMDNLYEQGIEPLPKETNSSKLLRRYTERFQWPLSIAIVLLLLEMFLPEQKSRRPRKTPAGAGNPGAAATAVLLAVLLAGASSSLASTSSAIREYNDGNYQDSLKDYKKLLEKKKDDPRLNYNAGAAAYQSHQLEEAAKQFENATTAQDLKLQQRAYYNLGNTYFRLGEKSLASPQKPQQGAAAATQGPDAAIKAWEEAVKNYRNAQALDPNDGDAKYNQGFVEKAIEELKKLQQQQQKQNQNKQDKNKDKKQDQKQDQPQGGDSKKDEQKQQEQQQQKQDSSGQKQDQSQQQKQDSSEKDKQQQQAQSGEKKDDSDKKDQAQSGSQNKDDAEAREEAEKEARMMAAGQMTPRQARQLLDSQKGEDDVLHLAPQNNRNNHPRSYKNW